MTILTNYNYTDYKRTIFRTFGFNILCYTYVLLYNMMLICTHYLLLESIASSLILYSVTSRQCVLVYGSEDESTSVQKICIMARDWT